MNKRLEKSKLPDIQISKSLDKYKGKVVFKEKLEEANKTLKRVGVPKAAKKHS